MRGRKICIIIPSRMGSSRFPNKPLEDIGGKSMIRRVYERCTESVADSVIVSTEDKSIYNHVTEFGNCYMTPKFDNGTLRVCHTALEMSGDFDYIINVQGDEPFIDPSFLDRLINQLIFFRGGTIITGATELKEEDMLNRSSVKMITDMNDDVISFTRSPFFGKNKNIFKHVGIYGFHKSDIAEISKLNPSPGSTAEQLEQIRWMEEGYRMKYTLSYKETIAIDTPEDLIRAKDLMIKEKMP